MKLASDVLSRVSVLSLCSRREVFWSYLSYRTQWSRRILSIYHFRGMYKSTISFFSFCIFACVVKNLCSLLKRLWSFSKNCQAASLSANFRVRKGTRYTDELDRHHWNKRILFLVWDDGMTVMKKMVLEDRVEFHEQFWRERKFCVNSRGYNMSPTRRQTIKRV
jgi:hypothetical protein